MGYKGAGANFAVAVAYSFSSQLWDIKWYGRNNDPSHYAVLAPNYGI